jgi:predicted GIY-YIG superfamily endonuclease
MLRRASADAVRLAQSMHYVYILNCVDGPYTGCTEDLKERIERHKNGHVPATRNRRPLQLVSYTAFQDKYKAFEFEKYLKSGSGRAFIKKHF